MRRAVAEALGRYEEMNLRVHAKDLSQKSAYAISDKLRKVGYVPFVQPSKNKPDKFDVMVKVN